jgi:hypothetical protein
MRERRCRPALLAAAPLAFGLSAARPALPAEGGAPSLRESIEALEARLDRAVSQVSRPAPGIVFGRAETARGYHLPGYGAVFVLTPRALPRESHLYVFSQRGAPPAGTARIRFRPHSAASKGEDPEAEELLAIEEQVREFQREVEELRQSAERDFERFTRDLRGRFEPLPQSPLPAGLPAPPSAPQAPVAVVPQPAAPPTAGNAPAVASAPAPDAYPAPALPAAPLPPEAPLLPPPPWRNWFESGGAPDQRAPDEVIAGVRTAVIAILEGEGARLELAGDEHLAVAVDFVPAGVFVSQARAARTVVIRARKRDLDARRAGKLSGEELRRRIEVSEY